jgi:gamma-glutamyltranspeptidase/glutathione hydrolase
MKTPRRQTCCLLALVAAFATGCAALPEPVQDALRAPEAATGFTEKPGWSASKFMAAAANPVAAEAGYRILQDGGSAVDAAIAIQMMLTLVEPQSSGIGGGAFLLHFDGRKVQAYDGRETAPASATESLFQDADGKVLPYYAGLVGGRSVGAPGVLRMLELAHQRHGRLPWASLFEPAIRQAEQGFAISPRLAGLIKKDPYLKTDPVAAAYFYDPAGNPWPVGHVLKNPELAAVLREIAAGGADAFYRGRTARAIEAKVKGHARNPGGLSATDLQAYRAKIREPVCSPYRDWNVCGMPPPSAGGVTIAQMLAMLETKGIGRFPPQAGMPAAQAVHLFSEAGRLAYADRDRYLADPDFVAFPGGSVSSLLDRDYLAGRAALIGERAMGVAHAGQPPGARMARGRDASPEFPSTSQISIVDAFGQAVSMTTTIEDAFGSRQMVRGFLLNNELTDFSFVAADEQGPVANRVQAGKRPRSSMAPTMVFEKGSGKLVLVIGSPGGNAIINYVAKVLVGVLDWRLDVQQAIDLPNFGSRNGPTELEQGRVSPGLVKELRERGHNVRLMEQTSGLQGIMRTRGADGKEIWFGGADPRREGVARGD